MGCVKITLLATYAFNAIMSLSRASTRGSYSRIEGVTHTLQGSDGLPLAPLYTGAGGHLYTQQLIIDLLAVCGALLHHIPPR